MLSVAIDMMTLRSDIAMMTFESIELRLELCSGLFVDMRDLPHTGWKLPNTGVLRSASVSRSWSRSCVHKGLTQFLAQHRSSRGTNGNSGDSGVGRWPPTCEYANSDICLWLGPVGCPGFVQTSCGELCHIQCGALLRHAAEANLNDSTCRIPKEWQGQSTTSQKALSKKSCTSHTKQSKWATNIRHLLLKTLCSCEPQIWQGILTSHDAQSACFKAQDVMKCDDVWRFSFWLLVGSTCQTCLVSKDPET